MITRSRIKWAEHGEKSSRYFCTLEKRNSEKKMLRYLKSEDGLIVNDHLNILDEIYGYYSKLYTSDSAQYHEKGTSFLEALKPSIPRLSEELKEGLNSPISKA